MKNIIIKILRTIKYKINLELSRYNQNLSKFFNRVTRIFFREIILNI